MKHVRVPSELLSAPFNNKSLQLNGLSVVDSCFYDEITLGSMFMEEHIILYVLKGKATLTSGRKKFILHKDEFILLQRATMYGFRKEGAPLTVGQGAFHGLLFCLKDEILLDFIRMSNNTKPFTETFEPRVCKANNRLCAFTESISPYFDAPDNIDDGLLRLKIIELLYDVAHEDKEMLRQLMSLGKPVRREILPIMEDSYMNPISVPELAYLTGRSLAGFKRDFHATFGISPTEWIRCRRLEKAKVLLLSSDISISDVCYTVGFENPTHFSRLFKEKYGVSPSQIKSKPLS